MDHRMIQGETIVQILMKLGKNCVNYTVLKFILCLKKAQLGPVRVSGGSFDMRINYLSMLIRLGHVYGA